LVGEYGTVQFSFADLADRRPTSFAALCSLFGDGRPEFDARRLERREWLEEPLRALDPIPSAVSRRDEMPDEDALIGEAITLGNTGEVRVDDAPQSLPIEKISIVL